MGWKLVPAEATEGMICAGYGEITTRIEYSAQDMRSAYSSMLAASPAPNIDALCIALAYSNPAGPQWWWRKNANGTLRDSGPQVEGNRDYDRAIMREFMDRIGKVGL